MRKKIWKKKNDELKDKFYIAEARIEELEEELLGKTEDDQKDKRSIESESKKIDSSIQAKLPQKSISFKEEKPQIQVTELTFDDKTDEIQQSDSPTSIQKNKTDKGAQRRDDFLKNREKRGSMSLILTRQKKQEQLSKFIQEDLDHLFHLQSKKRSHSLNDKTSESPPSPKLTNIKSVDIKNKDLSIGGLKHGQKESNIRGNSISLYVIVLFAIVALIIGIILMK